MKNIRNLLYITMAAAMLIFAVPRLEIGQGGGAASWFGLVWLGMLLLIIAAHLHEILGVNEQQKQEMARVKETSRMQTRAWIAQQAGKLRQKGK